MTYILTFLLRIELNSCINTKVTVVSSLVEAMSEWNSVLIMWRLRSDMIYSTGYNDRVSQKKLGLPRTKNINFNRLSMVILCCFFHRSFIPPHCARRRRRSWSSSRPFCWEGGSRCLLGWGREGGSRFDFLRIPKGGREGRPFCTLLWF